MKSKAISLVAVSIILASGTRLPADPAKPAVISRAARLVQQLGDDDFDQREAASDELVEIGEPALPALQTAAATDADPEIRWRATQAIVGIAARQRDAAGRRDLEKLKGTWYTVSTSYQGTRTPENRNDTITFDGNRYVQLLDGKLLAAGQITINDATANPKEMDYDATEGPYAGQFLGIYKFEGSDLVLCSLQVNCATANRPSTFSEQAGFMRVLKRVETNKAK